MAQHESGVMLSIQTDRGATVARCVAGPTLFHSHAVSVALRWLFLRASDKHVVLCTCDFPENWH